MRWQLLAGWYGQLLVSGVLVGVSDDDVRVLFQMRCRVSCMWVCCLRV